MNGFRETITNNSKLWKTLGADIYIANDKTEVMAVSISAANHRCEIATV